MAGRSQCGTSEVVMTGSAMTHPQCITEYLAQERAQPFPDRYREAYLSKIQLVMEAVVGFIITCRDEVA